MKKISKVVVLFSLIGLFVFSGFDVYAGNIERSGQAGATQLLINPWARSSGWAGSNVAGARGLEAMFLNVAGTAFTKKTEVVFSNTTYLQGSDIHINALGLTQHVGETGALGLAIMAMNFGDIDVTTIENPDGGLGTFSPSFVNLGLSYAKGFSDNIYGGIVLKVISEKTSNIAATGAAIDAGIQYVTGKYNHIKFGISLKNIGTRMKYEGDALTFSTEMPTSVTGSIYTVENRSESFEMPSLLNIAFGYDFYLKKDSTSYKTHRLTTMGTFTSNSFEKNNLKFGVEYAWKNMVMFRVGYAYEDGIMSPDTRTNVFTGPTAGFTVEVPFGKNESTFGLDYSYRATNPFDGTHSFGLRVNL